MYQPTHKEICNAMNLELQCSRCGSRVKNACQDCIVSFNHWNQCYEEAKNILIKRHTNPLTTQHRASRCNGKSAKAIDRLLDYLED